MTLRERIADELLREDERFREKNESRHYKYLRAADAILALHVYRIGTADEFLSEAEREAMAGIVEAFDDGAEESMDAAIEQAIPVFRRLVEREGG